MANVFTNIFTTPELRNRVLFTLGVLVLFRIGVQIPTPGIDPIALYDQSEAQESFGGVLSMLNLFTGGALANFAIFALGIMPYITSSIIFQLLQAVVPSLQRLQREGAYGRKRLQLYIRYGTIALAIIQSLGVTVILRSIIDGAAASDDPQSIIFWAQPGELPVTFILLFVLVQVTGSMLLLWLGEQVTERGVGNGPSLLIYSGIVAGVIPAVLQLRQSDTGPIEILVLLVLFVLIVFFVAGEQQATRRVPVQYARRVVGGRQLASPPDVYIPFKMNPAGVIPVIFASAIVMLPQQIVGWLNPTNADPQNTEGGTFLDILAEGLAPGGGAYIIVLFILTVIFAFFYTQIYFNTPQMAEDLKRQGGFVPGIRPGDRTAEHLSKILARITLPGALFLGLVAILPDVIMNVMGWFSDRDISYGGQEAPFLLLMGGTSLLIIVGVSLDAMRQLESHLLMHNKGAIFRSGKLRGRMERMGRM